MTASKTCSLLTAHQAKKSLALSAPAQWNTSGSLLEAAIPTLELEMYGQVKWQRIYTDIVGCSLIRLCLHQHQYLGSLSFQIHLPAPVKVPYQQFCHVWSCFKCI